MNSKPQPKRPRPSLADIRVVKKPKPSVAKNSKQTVKPAKKTVSPKQKPKESFFKKLTTHPLKNHPFVLPVLTFIFLSFLSMGIYIASNGKTLGASDTKVVNLYIDGKQQVVPTRASTVGDMLQKLNITVGPKDIVEPAQDTEIIDNNFKVNYYKAKPVIVVDGEKQVATVSAAPTPRKVAEDAGVVVYPEDDIQKQGGVIETEDVVRGGMVAETIVINRATPANINLYGSSIPIRTRVKTVADALKEKNIQTLPDDVITPAPDTPLAANTQIFITRVGKTISSQEEEIAMPTETVQDPTLPAGQTVIKQQGNPGRKVVTYEVELQNDKEVSRKAIQEIIAIVPVKQIVAKGTKPPTIIVAGDHAALMLKAGIPESQHGSAEYIINRESRWRLDARNSGGCLGLGQACPGSKLVNACPDYANDPVCQLRFFNGYAVGRYGSWNGAYNFWLINHWW